jgi:exonuclease SbcC
MKKEDDRSKAQDALNKAIERVPLAKQWVTLEAEWQWLKKQIQDADSRATDAVRIRKEHARFVDLNVAIPVLKRLITLRDNLSTASETLAGRQAEGMRLADAIKAKQIHEQLLQDVKHVAVAEAAEKLKNVLGAVRPNLAKELKAARERASAANDAFTAAVAAKAKATGLLDQAKARQQDFDAVEIGVKCSLCGQEVTAKHAKQERARLAAEISKLEEVVREAKGEEKAAAKANKQTAEEKEQLETEERNRHTAEQLLAEKQQTLRELGITVELGELRQQIADKTAEAESLETAAGDEARVDLAILKKRQSDVDKKVRADGLTIATMEGQQSTLRGQLSPKWISHAEKLDAKAVDALDAERQSLESSSVANKFQQLEQDATRRAAWIERQAEVMRQIEAIPADSHISVEDAEQQLVAARDKARNAGQERDNAKKRADDLAAAAERFAKLIADVASAERQSDLHRKLDELLGKGGLQRELVRTAEREIVRLANDTVQNLSDGDLTVELEHGADGDDEAFALQVRRADRPIPIGVNYLSGSQKFRVAVSVALAIGRFAAGQARPLESVIIDEGFGSLDRDGLRCAATELNRLRQYLRRIVLVSHQEEFADRFPVVIRLSHGENGTIAIAERK